MAMLYKENKTEQTQCLICNTESNQYFTKLFLNFGLSTVEYYRCPNCGFVFSKTHREMDNKQWQKLNLNYHKHIEDLLVVKTGERRPPPYFEQAAMLNVLSENNIVNVNNGLDWGSGYGTLSKILAKYYGLKIKTYDKYMPLGQNGLSKNKVAGRKFKTLINSAVFEHITDRRSLDEINSHVAKDGCLILHTLVRENIPCDPDWFYLLPVHTAFHTNKSMNILMRQWGYTCSTYCPLSKTWVLFKNPPKGINATVKRINLELLSEYLFFKKGFMDYWK